MKKNYSELVKRVRQSSNPNDYSYNKIFLNESVDVPYGDVNEYVKLAMWGVPKEYTDMSKAAAEMVIKTLEKNHGSEVEFRYQGSVETNTHIWNENDVDLVQITSKSSIVDTPGLNKALTTEVHKFSAEEKRNLQSHLDNFSMYQGDQDSDLRQLRLKSERILVDTYNDVDIKKSKAICVKMQKPKRNIDVVTATYYKPVPFMSSNQYHKKGIQVYDKDTDSKLPAEYPFWSIRLINDRNLATGRRFKKIIRFFKNVKYDCGVQLGRKLTVSSFDINAICYNIRTSSYDYLHYLQLVGILSIELNKLVNDSSYRNSLKSIDGQEYIFFNKGTDKVVDLGILRDAVDDVLAGIIYQNRQVG